MANMKDIRQRIKSVQSTMQITKAMELVSSSKFRRAKEKALSVRPYFNTINETIIRIAKENRDFSSVYTRERKIKNTAYVVVAGDRGLAGGYNIGVFKFAAAEMAGKSPKIITIGKKSMDYYTKRDFTVIENHPNIAEQINVSEVSVISKKLLELYRTGEIDEAFVVYTEFVSPLTQIPRNIKLLPIDAVAPDDEFDKGMLTQYDPTAEEVFDSIVPLYVTGILYGGIVESYASEQAARRLAMENASDNAQEMIDTLGLKYNRARQAAITQEITEIVAGSGNF